MDDLKKQMRDVAVLYYKEHLTQQRIADKMKTTRQNVSKLLNLAEKNGIVSINVADVKSTLTDLEKELEEKTGIKKAVIGETSFDDEKLREQATVNEACSYLRSAFKVGNLNIGVSWGNTVEAVVEAFQKTKTENDCVFPLLGAGNGKTSSYSANKIVADLSEKIGGTAKLLPLPYVASESDCTLLKKTDIYKEFENLWKKTDVAVVGIGNLLSLCALQNDFGKKQIDKTVIGDIASHPFNKRGEFLELYDNALCASIDDLKNAGNLIAIAYGKNKADAILSATKTGTVDTLITDEFTAREIVERADRDPRG